MPAPYLGGCQCGELRYEIACEPVTLYVCHCTDCQKQSSSAFGMSLTIPTSSLKIVSGTMKEWTRPAQSGASVFCKFCPTCGSRILHGKDSRPDFINIKAGTLDDTSWLAPVAQVWTKRAQRWVCLDADLLSYEAQPPDPAPMWARWETEHTTRLTRR